jgi:hypothetical protein
MTLRQRKGIDDNDIFLLANLVFCPPDIQSQIIYIIRLFLQKHIIIL